LKGGFIESNNEINNNDNQFQFFLFYGVRLTWSTTAKSLMIRTAIVSSRKLREAAEHLIDGSEKRICRSEL